jgi:hypothetical protein
MKKLIFLLVIPLLFAACGDLFESDGTYYFDVEGEGYAYYGDTNEPIPNAKVGVRTEFKSRGYATKQPVWEDYYTDETGHFRIKFIRRIDGENAVLYYISLASSSTDNRGSNQITIKSETLKQNKTVIQVGNLIVKPY